MPLLSILIPTVDPTERVPAIVRELLASEATSFQIVVTLNAPTSPLRLTEKELKDSRLLVANEPVRLNVAENWTKAVETSTGKYLWLIGDDDFILREQLHRVLSLLEAKEVDCLTFNAWSYLFPSTFTKQQALARERHFHYRESVLGNLTPAGRQMVIKNMYRFLPLIPLNMQLTIFSRNAFESIGDKFKMPFPDHIALMELLVTARTWIVTDERLCIVGMAPSSFGNSAYTNSDSVGKAYLGLDSMRVDPMPGNILNSVMLSWLQDLTKLNKDFANYRPSIGNYVIRQIGFSYRRWRSHDLSLREFVRNIKKSKFSDLVRALFSLLSVNNLRLVLKILARKPGPQKIIGSKFDVVSESDIESYAMKIQVSRLL